VQFLVRFRFDNFRKVVKSVTRRFDNFRKVVKSVTRRFDNFRKVVKSVTRRFDNFRKVVKSVTRRFDNFRKVVKSVTRRFDNFRKVVKSLTRLGWLVELPFKEIAFHSNVPQFFPSLWPSDKHNQDEWLLFVSTISCFLLKHVYFEE